MRKLNRYELYDVLYLSIIAGVLYILSSILTEANAQTRIEIERHIRAKAHAHGVQPELALAIVQVESSFNPNAVGGLGEIGLFQLRPEFHDVREGDVNHNITVAIKYLAELKQKCSHYGDAYFVCFNYGPNRAKLKHPRLFPYYQKVKTVQANRRQAYQIARK